MKKIKSKYITIAILCLLGSVAFLVIGFFNHFFFIVCLAPLVGYFIIDKKHLRCPHCNSFTNLDRLLYAKNHTYHCSSCGNVIEIE